MTKLSRSHSRLDRLLVTLIDGDPWRLEVALGLHLFGFGLWMLVPISHFDSSTAYRIMREWGSEQAWGTLLIIVGLIQLIISRRQRLIERRVASGLTFTTFCFIDTAFWLSGTTSTAPVTFAVMSLMAAWLMVGWLGKHRT